jgi:hypothetical protein
MFGGRQVANGTALMELARRALKDKSYKRAQVASLLVY